MSGQPSFCVVLPVYNEADCIEQCVRNIAAHLKTIETKTGILAVNDGSRDNSLTILQKLEKEMPDLVVRSHERNGGYGAANRTGARTAREMGYDYALVMDADGTQAPKYIDNFLEPMRHGVDFIKATRYAKGGRMEGVPWQRALISTVGNRLAQNFMRVPLTDFTNGFRAIKTGVWENLKTTERDFAMLIEEVYLARRMGVTFGEVPYVLTARREDAPASKFIYSFGVYRRYAQYLFKR